MAAKLMMLTAVTAVYKTARLGRSLTMSRSLPRRMPTAFNLKNADVLSTEIDRVKKCINFLDKSPEPFHCVAEVTQELQKNGFIQLDEAGMWRRSKSIHRGGKYYFTRNGSSVVAFTVGKKFKTGNGFKIVGAHVDSPNLKLKPCSKRSSNKLIQLR